MKTQSVPTKTKENFFFPEDLKNEMRLAAKQIDETMSKFVREAVRERLDRLQQRNLLHHTYLNRQPPGDG